MNEFILIKLKHLQDNTGVLEQQGVITPKEHLKRLNRLKLAYVIAKELTTLGYTFKGVPFRILFELTRPDLQDKYKNNQDYLGNLLDYLE